MNIGYCTNVHAGADLETTQHNLTTHALAVRDQLAPAESMGIGLWLSAATASRLTDARDLDQFAHWLQDERLLPFTLNGFPYGDFHQKVVKHDVYLPTWAEAERLNYTLELIRILDHLLPATAIGSISTLPLMWGIPTPAADSLDRCARNLLQVAQHLQELEEKQGRIVHLCIEPEPGCAVQTSHDVVRLYEEILRPLAPRSLDVTRYLRVCHDVCHAAVMFEDQADVITRYHEHEILIGKVQVSSAIRIPWQDLSPTEANEAADQLLPFAEDRYLHQTVVDSDENSREFFEDLLWAFKSYPKDRGREWRVHYHVPIYLEAFGHLRTTRHEILQCLAGLASLPSRPAEDKRVSHFEVETYAWNVLPESLQHESLAAGIAQEIQWFQDTWNAQRNE